MAKPTASKVMGNWKNKSMLGVAVRKISIICFTAGLILALLFETDWQNSSLIKAQDGTPRSYFVATSGSDKNSGTLEQPFRTIQKCAELVKAGDTCYVREGVYRETVIPANSGIANGRINFKPYQNETVTISGAEIVEGWSNHEESIYKTNLNWDLGLGNNQIFLDGQMMIEARWPNIGTNISQPVKSMTKTTSYSKPTKASGSVLQASLSDQDLTETTNFWKGAKINIQGGVAYWTQTGTVTSNLSGQLNFDFVDWGEGYRPKANNPYFLWGKLEALDTPSEWFLDSSNSNLYLWTPKGDSPANHLIEAKKRQNAFDLSNRSYIKIEGFHIFASTIMLDNNSSYNIIDRIDAKYIWHYTDMTKPDHSKIYNTGINIKGNNNSIINSRIIYSAGTGISVGGSNHKIKNNVVSEVCYAGYEGAGIYIAAGTGHEVTQNTVYNSGRHTLMYNPLNTYDAPEYVSNIKIAHNHLYNSNLQTPDGGLLYTAGNGGGAEIAYNVLHDNNARTLKYGNYKGAGLYIDVSSSNFIIHHNVIWNAFDAMIISIKGINVQVNNNTFLGDHLSLTSYGPQNFKGTKANNNIFTNLINTDPVFSAILQKNNLYNGTDPKFVNAKFNNYQLEYNSPAVDAGDVIPPYTDGYIGSAPDIGAYEYGREPWKAGAENIFTQ